MGYSKMWVIIREEYRVIVIRKIFLLMIIK